MRGIATASTVLRAGQRHRLMQGVGRSGNEDGDFHDAPDWEFAGAQLSFFFPSTISPPKPSNLSMNYRPFSNELKYFVIYLFEYIVLIYLACLVSDGTPAPTTRRQVVWQTKREEEEARIQRLREEVMEMEQKELDRAALTNVSETHLK
jgi:hypothetical protein